MVAKISKTDKNWAHYNFLRLLFYVFIFQKNLQSVQKKMKKKMKKKHCDLNFWSIDSPTRKGGLVDMVLVGFILIIDARQAATLPRAGGDGWGGNVCFNCGI